MRTSNNADEKGLQKGTIPKQATSGGKQAKLWTGSQRDEISACTARGVHVHGACSARGRGSADRLTSRIARFFVLSVF